MDNLINFYNINIHNKFNWKVIDNFSNIGEVENCVTDGESYLVQGVIGEKFGELELVFYEDMCVGGLGDQF